MTGDMGIRAISIVCFIGACFGCSIPTKRASIEPMPRRLEISRGEIKNCDGANVIGCAERPENPEQYILEALPCRIELSWTADVCVLLHELAHCSGLNEAGARKFEVELGCGNGEGG